MAVQMAAQVASQHADIQAQLNRMAAFFSGSSEDVNKNWLRWVQRVRTLLRDPDMPLAHAGHVLMLTMLPSCWQMPYGPH